MMEKIAHQFLHIPCLMVSSFCLLNHSCPPLFLYIFFPSSIFICLFCLFSPSETSDRFIDQTEFLIYILRLLIFLRLFFLTGILLENWGCLRIMFYKQSDITFCSLFYAIMLPSNLHLIGFFSNWVTHYILSGVNYHVYFLFCCFG